MSEFSAGIHPFEKSCIRAISIWKVAVDSVGWKASTNGWSAVAWNSPDTPAKIKFTNNTGDEAEMDLTLHGKIGNIPASEVELIVQKKAPHGVTLRGVVSERQFYGPKLKLVTELSLLPNSNSIATPRYDHQRRRHGPRIPSHLSHQLRSSHS